MYQSTFPKSPEIAQRLLPRFKKPVVRPVFLSLRERCLNITPIPIPLVCEMNEGTEDKYISEKRTWIGRGEEVA